MHLTSTHFTGLPSGAMSTGVMSPSLNGLNGFPIAATQNAPVSDLYSNGGIVYSMAEPQLQPALNMSVGPYGGLGEHFLPTLSVFPALLGLKYNADSYLKLDNFLP